MYDNKIHSTIERASVDTSNSLLKVRFYHTLRKTAPKKICCLSKKC